MKFTAMEEQYKVMITVKTMHLYAWPKFLLSVLLVYFKKDDEDYFGDEEPQAEDILFLDWFFPKTTTPLNLLVEIAVVLDYNSTLAFENDSAKVTNYLSIFYDGVSETFSLHISKVELHSFSMLTVIHLNHYKHFNMQVKKWYQDIPGLNIKLEIIAVILTQVHRLTMLIYPIIAK